MKGFAKRIFRRLGYDVRRVSSTTHDPAPPPDAFSEQQRLLEAYPPSVIFDVGAHHGETARIYRELFPTARIYCFEPFAESFAALAAALPRLPGVQAFKLALADRVGSTILHANELSATNSLLPTAPTAATVWPGQVVTRKQVQVPTTTLDAFCREQGIETIDVLKVDVQGAEPLVFQGGAQMLRSGRVRLVYTEILTLPTYTGQLEFHEFLGMLNGFGFALFNLFNPSTTAAGQLRQVDAIFVPAGEPGGQLPGK